MPLRPSRRWLRFSLRTLLVLVTVFCVWLGWQVSIVHERKAALAKPGIVERVVYPGDDEWNKADSVPTLPFWRYWMGDRPVPSIILSEDHALEVGLPGTDELQRVFPDSNLYVATARVPYARWRARFSPEVQN